MSTVTFKIPATVNDKSKYDGKAWVELTGTPHIFNCTQGNRSSSIELGIPSPIKKDYEDGEGGRTLFEEVSGSEMLDIYLNKKEQDSEGYYYVRAVLEDVGSTANLYHNLSDNSWVGSSA